MAVRGGVQLGEASGTSMWLKKTAQRLPPRGLFHLESVSRIISNATLSRGVLLPEHLQIGCAAFFGSLQNGEVSSPCPTGISWDVWQTSQKFS